MKIGTKVRATRRNGEKITGNVAKNKEGGSGAWVGVTWAPKGATKARLLWKRESELKVVA